MFYEVSQTAQRDIYNLIIGLVAPRPIAWVTSLDGKGRLNAAPFSAFNYVALDPPMVAIGVANRAGPGLVPKDTGLNIRESGEFVVNVVSEELVQQMNVCAVDFPRGVNEVEVAGLRTAPSSLVKAPRLADSPASLECREHSTIRVGRSSIVLGSVVAIHVQDRFIDPAGPYVKAEEVHAVGRMNGLGRYVRTRDAFFNLPRLSYQEWLKTNPPPPGA
ncbi:MAG TPA: flavin reductase family protein [Opitutaceae bacterium]|nr:flavin reductase family protein [Opitutaceae bacterium]